MSMIDKKIGEFKTWAFKKGEDFFEVTDKDLLGKWNVLCFYPGDFTFVCPTELEDLQQQYNELKKLGVEVYSVSTDSHFTHKAWHDASDSIKKINYIMLGDITHEMTKSFDVYTQNTGQAQRATFIIDPDGIVRAVEINSNGIGRDASTLINKVKAAQYIRKNPSEVCPAKWQEGGETITPSLDLIGKI